MRYVLAFTSLALAAVFAILGIGQVTFLSGPAALTAPLEPDPSVHYSVITSDVLLSQTGQASLNIEAKGKAFAGYGPSKDVAAWVAPFDHEVFSLNPDTGEIESRIVSGVTGQTPAKAADQYPISTTDFKNPAGSDLWLGESVAEKKVTLLADATDQTSMIFATNGEKPQPTRVELAWIQDQSAPWFGPLMVTAGVFALLGVFLYLLAVDHDRRKIGPRRGRTGPFQGIRDLIADKKQAQRERQSAKLGRIALSLSVIAAVTFGASGCSARYWPSVQPAEVSVTESPTPTENAEQQAIEEEALELPPVPVTEPQLANILARIATVSDEADADASIELIKQRFVGSALAQREANYKIRGAVPETPLPLSLTGTLEGYNLVQSTDGWPRTILATVASTFPEGQEPPQDAEGNPLSSPALAVLIRQDSPYSNYLVHSIAEVRGGIVFPEAAAVEQGVALLPTDVKSTLLPPNRVGAAFGEILAQGEAAPDYALFDVAGDALLAQMGQAWVTKSAEEAAAKGESVEYSIEISQADDVVAMSTGAGGALVSVTINEKHIARSTQTRGAVKVTPSVKALSGMEGTKRAIYQLWQNQMLFYVPSVDSGEKIRILGSTTAMTGAGEG